MLGSRRPYSLKDFLTSLYAADSRRSLPRPDTTFGSLQSYAAGVVPPVTPPAFSFSCSGNKLHLLLNFVSIASSVSASSNRVTLSPPQDSIPYFSILFLYQQRYRYTTTSLHTNTSCLQHGLPLVVLLQGLLVPVFRCLKHPRLQQSPRALPDVLAPAVR